MKMYTIWMEGYAATGEHGYAQCIAVHKGENFPDACNRANKAGKFKGYGDYDPDELSLWRCCLYPTEKEARKAYG